jgi:urease accessory protein
MNPPCPTAPRNLTSRLLPLVLAATASVALAHPGHGPADGILPGFAHPFSGWDHALAMIAVGIWAAQLGAPRLVPAAFIGMMAVGGVLGHLTGSVPGLDQGIAASVLVLGLLIARTVRLPVALAASIVGLFAIFHGMAHGAEMPATAGGLAYGAGFIAATAILHAAGVGIGFLALRRSARLPQFAGWAIAAAGVALVAL